MTKKVKRARAMNSKKDRKPRTMQAEQTRPEAPVGKCLNIDAYFYSSGTNCD